MNAFDFWQKYGTGNWFLIGYKTNPDVEDMVYITDFSIPLNTLTIFSNTIHLNNVGTDDKSPIITISVNDIAWHKPIFLRPE